MIFLLESLIVFNSELKTNYFSFLSFKSTENRTIKMTT
ncbi:hypothetical protein RU93_GL002164 [Enterococcus aquimarinus]|uniref:Uncharacterized protein n=1 Tax=Enterococcus aquimarinus TaxID=328396 RepID=A0A1L8QS80_9ENTE|nr:hypothetical protein RU93_GL002164 [Enterococcus aquimarinus]